jgi:DnaJ-domain-containing protein 1
MADYFALLDEPRRPWLDPEILKAKFHALAARVHPDRVNSSESEKQAADSHYAEVNAAYQCLREPKERLRHLLEVERGSPIEGVQNIPSDTMDLSMEVSRLCREADCFLAEKAKVTSPLLKVQLFEKGLAITERLNSLLVRLAAKLEALTMQLQILNMAWETAPPVGASTRLHVLPCSRLEQIYRDLSYLTRWTQQLQERRVTLSL